jgi:hypothetical protein
MLHRLVQQRQYDGIRNVHNPLLQEGTGFAHCKAAYSAAGAEAAHAVGKKKETGLLINKNGVIIHALFSSFICLPRYAH